MAATGSMRASLLSTPGPPSNLELVELPIPIPREGEILIRVKAFGLNRSEILTRKFGRAPVGLVQFPRVLGVQATGIVEAAPGHEGECTIGSLVMTAVGGMGIAFDGGYAQYTCASKANVQRIKSEAESLGWDNLGALSEMLQTAHGSLFRSVLELVGGTTLPDSLACLAKDGICCLLGLVGGSPLVPDFNPLR